MDDLTEILTLLADRYEGWEIVELLSLSSDDVIEAFKDLIEDRIDDFADILEYKNDE